MANAQLAYFTKRLGVLKGQLVLDATSRCARVPDSSKPCVFRVTGEGHKDLMCQAESSAEVSAWIRAIRTNIARLQWLSLPKKDDGEVRVPVSPPTGPRSEAVRDPRQ